MPFPENGDLPASDTATPPEGYRPNRPDLDLTSNADVDSTHSSDQSAGDCPEEGYSPNRPDLDLTSNADVDSTHSSDQSAGDCPEEGYSPNRPDLDLTSNADVDSTHSSDQSNRDCPEEGSRPNRLDVDLTSTADVDSTHSFDQSAGDGPLEGSLPNPIDLTSNADLDGTDSSDDGSLVGRNADLKYLDDTATPKEGHSEEELTPPAYFHRYCDELTNYNDESESWRMYLLYNGSKLGITPPLFGTATFTTYRSPSWEDITEGAAKPSVPRAALPRSREVIPRTSIILTLTKLLRELSVDSFKDKNTFGGKFPLSLLIQSRITEIAHMAIRTHRPTPNC